MSDTGTCLHFLIPNKINGLLPSIKKSSRYLKIRRKMVIKKQGKKIKRRRHLVVKADQTKCTAATFDN